MTVEAFVVGAQSVNFTLDGQQTSAAVKDGTARAVFTLEHARLWDGLDDPYLYTVTARLDVYKRQALTFAASSIICAFGLAAAAPRSPYRHLELCGIALINAGDDRLCTFC